MKTRTLNDGFIWLVVDKEIALQMFRCNHEIYRLYDDGSEGLCETEEDIKSTDSELGFGIGFIYDLNNIEKDSLFCERECK